MKDVRLQGNGPRVLVVHDPPSILSPLEDPLRDAGYIVERCDSSRGAIERAHMYGADILLVEAEGDLARMKALCERVTRDGESGPLPVVAIGARFDPEIRFAALAAGADEVLQGPLRIEEAIHLIGRHARRRKERAELALARERLTALETTLDERTATLERQIRFTSQIIDSLPVSLYVVDRHRRIVAWNRQREMGSLGLAREKVIGRAVFEVFDQQKREAIESELTPVFDDGESLMFERDSNSDGDLRHYRIRKLPMQLGDGGVTHVLTIGEDITEQRRMEKSMMVAEKMAAMGRLASGVAHEINNPLATIVTCADGLRSRLTELPSGSSVSHAFREYLDIVEQEAYRAKRITEDLLDFSRVRPSSKRTLSLEKILDRTLLVLKHHAGFKKIVVERQFEDDGPPVAVEEDAIVQVFVALIINALDAMLDGGRLTLTTSSSADEVRCEVRDTGSGIAPDVLPRIFEPFFTTKPPGRGTGLGLAVCYGIMQAHGGRIEVDATPGEGSRFIVILPAASARAAAATDEEGSRACSQAIRSGS